MIFRKSIYQKIHQQDFRSHFGIGGEMAISDCGTPNTGCGMLFRPIVAEFNH